MSDDWFQLYKKVYDDKVLFAEKAWETIKFHTLLSSSLISITVGALVGIHTSKTFLDLEPINKVILTAFFFILPLIMNRIVKIGFTNFRRECNRMYEQSAVLMKLEEKFGFMSRRNKNTKWKQLKNDIPKPWSL